MKIIAISLVVIVLGAAFYITDRKVIQQKTVHAADSLDSINSGALHYSVDSLMRLSDRNYEARLMQLRLRIDFQYRIIHRLQNRVDSLIRTEHGRQSH